jgi:hypothetical protein
VSEDVRTLLWEWVGELDDDDPEQLAWKRAQADGMLMAAERARVLPAGELVEWRALAAGGVLRAAAGDRAAAERHLDDLLAALRPMTRETDPAARAASRRFSDALDALAAAGLVEEAEWRRRALAAEAPWMDADEVDELSSGGGIYAVAIPPQSPEDELDDLRHADEMERLSRRGDARRVLVAPAIEHHDELAVVAAVLRTDSTELVFHRGGMPFDGRPDLGAFREIVDALTPPALADAAGTPYEPAAPRPVSASGASESSAITGIWRYQPAAPVDLPELVATRNGARWVLR